MKFWKKYRWDFLILLGLLLVAAAARAWLFGREALWLDEAYSLRYAGAGGFGDIVSAVIENKDSHPPFYYLLLGGWQFLFGGSEVMARAFSVIFGLVTVAGGYFFGKEIRDRWLGAFVGLVMGSLFFAAYYSVEMRMYSLVLAMMVGSLLLVWRLFEKGNWRQFVGLVVLGVAMLYTHYYATFWLLFLYLFWLAMRKNLKQWFWSAVIIVAGFLPWAGVLWLNLSAKASGGEDNFTAWITLPDPPYEIFEIVFERFFSFGFGGVLWLLLGLGVIMVVRAREIFDKKILWMFSLGFAVNLVLPYVISLWWSPIIHPRYMQGTFLLVAALVALILWSLKKWWLRGLGMLAVLGYSVFVFWTIGETRLHPDWDVLFEEYGESMAGQNVMSYPDYYLLPLEYHIEKWGVDAEAVKWSEDSSGDLIFIERLPVPEIINEFRQKCDLVEEDRFERIGYYKFEGC